MADLFYVALTAAFFTSCWALVRLTERL